MRILFDATQLPSRPAGTGSHLIGLLRALSERWPEDADLEIAAKSEHAGPVGEAAPHARIHLVRLPARPIRLLWEQMGLPGLAADRRITVVHSPHYTRPMRLRAASVVTVHDLSYFLYPQYHTLARRLFFRRMIPAALRRATVVLASSRQTRHDLVRLFPWLAPTRVRVAHIGIDAAAWARPAAPTWRALLEDSQLTEPYVLAVGTVEPRKNFGLLVEAVRCLADRGRPVRLVIAGQPGWGGGHLEILIARLGLEQQVRWMGYVPIDVLRCLYWGAAVVAYPSQYEGFGIPVLEGMAAGVPVVACRVPGVTEVAGDAGLLVEPNDVRAFADALERVLTDAELRAALVERGLRQVGQYTWTASADATLEAYREAHQRGPLPCR